VEAGAAIDGVDAAAGEEFEDGGADEELDDGVGREADVEFEGGDRDAPESQKPGNQTFGRREEQEEESDVEIELVAEGPALQEEHEPVGGDEEIGGDDVVGLGESGVGW